MYAAVFCSDISINEIELHNITATQYGGVAGLFLCSTQNPCQNFTAEQVSIKPSDKGVKNEVECVEVYGRVDKHVSPKLCWKKPEEVWRSDVD